MEPKTITVLLIVFVCIFLFPIGIGIIGGIFGVIGAVFGAIFGVIGGVFGVVFGAIGAVIGALMGAIGWIFGDHYGWDHSFSFFNRDVFVAIVLVIVVLAITRSKRSGADHRGRSR